MSTRLSSVGCKKCGHLACICKILAEHEKGCSYRFAAVCAVPIECEHGYDVCPTCDPCTCKKQQSKTK